METNTFTVLTSNQRGGIQHHNKTWLETNFKPSSRIIEYLQTNLHNTTIHSFLIIILTKLKLEHHPTTEAWQILWCHAWESFDINKQCIVFQEET